MPPMFVHQLPNWLTPVQRDPDVQAMAEAWQKEYEQQLAQSGDELKTFQATLPDIFRATEPIVAQGHPAEQILAMIARQKIDLAIVGSRGTARSSGCWSAARRRGSSTKRPARC